MADVQLADVKKIYPGGFAAIHGVSFAVPDGGFCVLVGPSGCGKSTLLRMIAGLESITAGDIRIGDRVVNRLEPTERDIAMVFQNYALYPHMSVYDNMAYGLRNLKTPKPEIEARVAEAARILELDSALLSRKPRQLSGGQRQRVAMGRAIVRKPKVFLFDEPLSNLDAKLRVQMRIEIRRLQRRLGTTSVYVTHDQLEAMTLADMLVVMNAGRVEQIGAPLELYERPATLFVAGFLGSPPMNFLKGTLESPSTVRLEDGTELACDAAYAAVQRGAKVVAGVRPERALVRPAGEGLALKIELIEELGVGRLVHGQIAGTPMTLAIGPDHQLPSAEAIGISIPADAVHLFDAESGNRL
ncbi:MAG: sn-glycerol 3-phosphate transport system ATP-binding protein [Methylobacteriaceae bacterium]|jgi:sn-glycerol 3-phosphate transport system ATP-binding protein|nr:sn-glycerol 3-phosphate transport system ATP-binding protein [Methylobacteriaceae bacterium]